MAERIIGPDGTQRLELNLQDNSKASIFSITNFKDAKFSPKMLAHARDDHVRPFPQVDSISIAKTTHSRVKMAVPIPDVVFDPRYTALSKQTDHTVNSYGYEYGKFSFDQCLSKSMQATLNVGQASNPVTVGNAPATADAIKDKDEDPYNDLSQSIIDELLVNVQTTPEGDIRIADQSKMISRISRIIKTFVTHNHSRLVTIEQVETTVAANNNEGIAHAQKILLRQLVKQREKTTKTLAFSSPECYLRIIPGDVCNRLGDNKRCIANKADGKSRCSREKDIDGEAARILLGELANLTKPREFSKVMEILAGVIENAICKQHHRDKASAELEKLRRHFCAAVSDEQKTERKADLIQLDQWLSLLPGSSVLHHQVDRDEGKSCTIKSVDEVSDQDPDKTLVEESEAIPDPLAPFIFEENVSTPGVAGSRVAAFPVSNGTVLKYFIPFQKCLKAYKGYSPDRLVEVIAKMPLSPTDRSKVGQIYVFWHPGNFEWVKIGYTTRGTKGRIEQWKAQCGYDASEHASETTLGDRVRHPIRLERLIHAELKNGRHKQLSCEGCGKSHDEWFWVGSKRAQEVVKKWTEWMQASDPYDADGNFRTDTVIELPSMNGQTTREIPEHTVSTWRGKRSLQFTVSSPRRSSRIAARKTGQRSKQA